MKPSSSDLEPLFVSDMVMFSSFCPELKSGSSNLFYIAFVTMVYVTVFKIE